MDYSGIEFGRNGFDLGKNGANSGLRSIRNVGEFDVGVGHGNRAVNSDSITERAKQVINAFWTMTRKEKELVMRVKKKK